MLRALDQFFFLFHAGFILFNLVGWIPRRTRALHRAAVLLTALSWFGLGLFYGIGYCPLTEWHWRVLRALGREGLPRSYTSYLVQRILGWAPEAGVMDFLTGVGFGIAFCFALGLYVAERKRSRVLR